jgi:hypothetical protein
VANRAAAASSPACASTAWKRAMEASIQVYRQVFSSVVTEKARA